MNTSNNSINSARGNLTFMYTIHQVLYWVVVCCIVSFAATYLTEKGLAVSTVGIILFSANMLSFVLQLFMAGIADKAGDSRAIKTLMTILSAVPLVIMVALTLTSPPLWLMAILYVPMVAGFDMNLPLMNSIVVFYSRREYRISFGIARAIGAGSFGLASLIMGYAIKGLGSDISLIVAIFCAIAFIVIVLLYPKEGVLACKGTGIRAAVPADTAQGSGTEGVKAAVTANAGGRDSLSSESLSNESLSNESLSNESLSNESLSIGQFLVKYKWYAISLLGVMCFGAVHLASENYLIEIVRPLGGDSSTVGTALMIATVLEMPVTLVAERMYRKLQAHKLWMLVGISYTLRMLILLFAGNIWMIYLAQALQVTSYAPMPPSQLFYARDCVDDRDMVKGQSTSTALYSLGNALGNLFGGLAVSAFGVASMLKGCVAGAFIGFAVVAVFVPFAVNARRKVLEAEK